MDITSQHDIITIKNILPVDFSFSYAKSEGGRTYTILAGATMMFPRFLAAHAVKHMIDAVLTNDKVKTNNELARIEAAEKIIVHEETYSQPTTPSETDRLNQRVEELNKPTDLENILAKRNKKPAEAAAAVGAQPDMQLPDQPKPQLESVTPPVAPIRKDKKFAGLKAGAKLKEAVDEQIQATKEAAKKPLTKDILRNFAIHTLKLNIDGDPKMTKAFENLSVEKLADLLKYNENQEE